MKQRYKLTAAAKMLGVNPWTLRRWVYAGKAPSIKSESGHVFIPGEWLSQQLGESPPSVGVRCAIYGRESSSENKAAMESQVDGCCSTRMPLNLQRDRSCTMKHLALSYPLRRDFMAQIVIPKDLTTEEAKRLRAFLLALAKPSGI